MLKTNCTYCNSLSKAIRDQNYCSVSGDSIGQVMTNAYYFKTNALSSGKHISRLSIRAITDGYQVHQLNRKELHLDRDSYLVVNEGELFQSQIKTNHAVEGIVVAFKSTDIAAMNKMYQSSVSELLDNPFYIKDDQSKIDSKHFQMNADLKLHLKQLMQNIKLDYCASLFYEELFAKILKTVTNDYDHLDERINQIKATKRSTKIEIVRRLALAKEYMDKHMDEDVSLNKLSMIATLSPYHLLRSFKDFYTLTPHQYLVDIRLKKAKFLLRDTTDTVKQITKMVGFNNVSSFSRLFRETSQMTPLVYRKLYKRKLV